LDLLLFAYDDSEPDRESAHLYCYTVYSDERFIFSFLLSCVRRHNLKSKKVGATPEQIGKFFVSADKKKSLRDVRELPETWFDRYHSSTIFEQIMWRLYTNCKISPES